MTDKNLQPDEEMELIEDVEHAHPEIKMIEDVDSAHPDVEKIEAPEEESDKPVDT